MVAMNTYHVAYIRIDAFGKYRFVVPELPSRHFYQCEQAQFVACVHKGRVDDVVCTDHLQAGIAQLFGIAPLQRVGECVAQYGKILMPVCSHDFSFVRFSVQPQTFGLFEFDAPYAQSLPVAVDCLAGSIFHQDVEVIKIRCFGRPQLGGIDFHGAYRIVCLSPLYGERFCSCQNSIAFFLFQLKFDGDFLPFGRLVADVCFQVDNRAFFRNPVVGNEQSSSGNLIFVVGIGYEDIVVRYQPAVAINTSEIGIVQQALRFSYRISGIITIVSLYGNHIFAIPFYSVGDVGNDG